MQAHLLRDDAVEVVLALTSASQHPISNAVAKHLSSQSSTSENSLNLEGFHSVPGSGIEARYDDKVLRGGSPQWLNVDDHSAIVEMKTKQLTLFAVTHGGEPIAAFGLRDGLRAGAGEAVDMLQRRGIEVHIVSGDQPGVVSAIAANLKLAPERAIGGCKPQDKQQYVKALQAVSGRNRITGRVMFFGDGTNDSLALVQADIGVSLSSGTDVAMSAADIVYMDGKNLERSIRTTLDISEGAVRRIYVSENCVVTFKRLLQFFFRSHRGTSCGQLSTIRLVSCSRREHSFMPAYLRNMLGSEKWCLCYPSCSLHGA